MAMDFETLQSEHPPLVSVVIPAFKAKYLQAAMDSLLAQDFSDYEIVVGDDCPSNEVHDLLKKIVEDGKIGNFRYHRNEPALGGGSNFSACIGRARGKYIKPLFDDDFLLEGALSRFVQVLARDEQVSVVGSRRLLVGEQGEKLADNAATVPLFEEDVVIKGKDLVSFLGDVTLNFIGEPSSIMFRRDDYGPICVEHAGLYKLGGQYIEWVADLAVTVKLLRRGDLALLHEPYSAFRVSKEQFSQQGRDQPGIGEKGHSDFRRMIRELGWYRAKDNHLVRIRPLNDPDKDFEPFPLAEHIRDRAKELEKKKQAAASWGVPDWMRDRAPSAARILAVQTMLQANPDVGTLGAAIIVPDGVEAQAVADTLESLGVQHRPVEGVWLIGNGAVPEGIMQGAERVGGTEPWPWLLSRRVEQGGLPDFLWILHAGDRLLPHATLTLGEYRLRRPDPLVWYADEAVLKEGRSANPMLKPDFSIDLLRSYPYVGRNLVISTAAIQAAGGLDAQVVDLAPIDLIWRMVEQAGPPVVGHVPEVLLHGARGLMEWVSDADTLTWFPIVTQTHFVRMGLDALVQPGPVQGLFRVEYPLSQQPLVSIIVPTRDQFSILRDCVEGLMERTAYPNYELLIVDNGSEEPGAVEFLAKLEDMALDQVRVLRWPQAFDFAAMNNFAAERARGDVLLFLNNDIQFSPQTRSDWLERLLRLALRPEVGMAGTRLDLPDGRVDQYGQVPGLDNSVGSAFRGEPSDRQGYMYRLAVQQNASTLSASCLMMRRSVFQELGGFDARSFPVYYADTDLSLKAVQAGYLLALEPDTGLLHMGGATRLLTEKFGLAARPDDEQRDRLYARWLPQLARDPYYHPAFGKFSPGFNLSQDASRIHEPLPGRPLPVVLASHADWHGCGHYRIVLPFKAMSNELRVEGGVKFHDFHFTDVARIQPDVIVLQGAWLNDGILTQIRRYREITGAKVVLEFDDYLPNIPTRSVYRKKASQGWTRKMRRAIEQVDWLVVSTPVLAQEYAEFHEDIRVALNGLPPEWWGGLECRRRTGRKMRVGWAGGISHTGDLAEIRSVVKDLQGEVEWVFMGMKPDDVACEFHPGVPIDQYPAKLAALNLDLAVVPLELNQFNRSKSNLRLLELGACGVPVICTDIDPYRGDLPVMRVRNRHQDWVQAIRDHVADPDMLARRGDALREAVLRDWMLEGAFLDQWAAAWGVASVGV
jgi:GT2 family glycosyltransferase